MCSNKMETQVWTRQHCDEGERGVAATASGFNSCCSRSVAYLQGDDGTETELIQQSIAKVSFMLLYIRKFSSENVLCDSPTVTK